MDDLPWSQPVRLSEVARGPERRHLEPSPEDRARIAKSLNLLELPELSADVEIAPWLDGVELRGSWRGRVVQTCGITLEPFETGLSGSFEVRAVPAGSPLAESGDGGEVELDLDAADPPDVLEEDRVDPAAYVVEHLALEIDPFPRKPGATFEPPESEPEASPFASLLQLKPRA